MIVTITMNQLRNKLQSMGALSIEQIDNSTLLNGIVVLPEIDSNILAQKVKDNMGLVVHIAKKLYHDNLTLSFDDIVQEGAIGLMVALQRYDISLGFEFSTYATWWIKQSISRSISNQNRLIRLPVHKTEQISEYMRVKKELENKFNRVPTRTEMAKHMKISNKTVATLERELMEVYSLDSSIGEDGSYTLMDTLESDENVEKSIIDTLDGEKLRKLLSEILTDREQRIIEKRFGINDGIRRTLEEIASDFGVTRERIRQIESKALLRLRRNRKLRALFQSNGNSV